MNDIGFYMRLLSRRLPFLAAIVLLSTCIATVMALRLPTTYKTTATLLVEAAQISPDLLRVTSQESAEEQLDIITRRLTTRANLIALARDNRIFPNQSSMEPDDVVDRMLKKTRIDLSSGRDAATVMEISFEGRHPERVAAVVNQYVSIAVEANSATRTERAEGTLEFFQQEVDTLSIVLDEQSAKIVAFKTQNADALPENLDYRLGRQALLQERLSRAERDLEGLRAQRRNIEEVYRRTGLLENENLSPEQMQLNALQSELRVARGIYSESNPRVRLLRQQIDVLELQIAEQQALYDAGGGGEQAPRELSALEINLTELDAQTAALEQEIKEAVEELDSLSLSIEMTPTNGIALEALERDLQNTQELYAAAVGRMSEARMGERIELSAKGERVTILEPASVPTSPSGPNRAGIIGLGMVFGLALAGSVFMLLEVFNNKVRRPADLERVFQITALSTIPRFETATDRNKRRIVQGAMLLLVAVTVPAATWAVDTYYMPLDELFAKVMARLR